MSKNMELLITAEQANEFIAARADAQIAAAKLQGIAIGILAGHGITDGTVADVRGTTLTVIVPDQRAVEASA